MEFVELADYPLRTGRVTEWQAAADTHWADWPRDARAVSHNHEHHLREALEHNRIRAHRHCWLGCVVRIDGPLDRRAWGAALTAWFARHELLRSHVAIEGGRTARYTLPPGRVRVRAADAGRPASAMSAYRLVQQLLDERTSPLDWPSHVCVTVEDRDSFTAVVAADHAVMDGYSTTTIGGELRELYDAARVGDRPAPTPVASYLDFCEVQRSRADAAGPEHPAAALWREFLAGATGHEAVPGDFAAAGRRPVLPAAAVPHAAPQRTLAIEVLDAAAADRAAAHARAQGQSLAAVLPAAFAAAHAELTGGREFRAVLPLHTRDEPRWADSLGWFVGLAPYRVDCAASGLAELVGPSGAELCRVRAAATVPFGRVCELLDIRPRVSLMVSYMDIRATPGAPDWPGSDTRWLRSRTRSADEFFYWFLRTPDGVTLNLRYPGTARATRAVHRHALRVRRLLADYARDGDAPLHRTDPPATHTFGQGASTWR
ncbi:condensation domain-containing protein [Nocardia blacklockiae]|uniref:condensation domain-containing protein n=1 Tax=Nocardia blacklockiae TaxID=480036 RepID=UPI001893E1BF|nr:condensation domain-containing protein [Nocardia blacklockiae]MBF6170516.1 condensation protein [Nocardia blacklockiae]